MKKLLREIKKSTVFLGFIDNNKPIYLGTGFLIKVEGVFYVCTAKHVVENDFQRMFIFFNSKNFGVSARSIQELLVNGAHWVAHKNEAVDIALIPLFVDLLNDDVKFIEDNLFIHNVEEMSELTELFYSSHQPGITDMENGNIKINPIFRKGYVSRLNSDKTFYMDGFAFPGNSGSPVFTLPTPIRIKDSNVEIGGPIEIKLAGVIGAYVPYNDEAVSRQTGLIKTISTENTGLSLIHSTELLMEIIKSDDFKEQQENIKKIIDKNSGKSSKDGDKKQRKQQN